MIDNLGRDESLPYGVRRSGLVFLILSGAEVITAITLGEPMPNRQQTEFLRAAENITGTRFCTQCKSYPPKDGGKWIPISGGLRQRWKCAGCLKRQKERLQTVS